MATRQVSITLTVAEAAVVLKLARAAEVGDPLKDFVRVEELLGSLCTRMAADMKRREKAKRDFMASQKAQGVPPATEARARRIVKDAAATEQPVTEPPASPESLEP